MRSIPGLRAACEAAGDEPPAWEYYERLTRANWVKLVEAQLGEAQYQEFLETNPCFVPGGRSVDGPSGHGPWPHALIRQPKLPGLATRQPDFMWIATDSESTYPVLVELERPDKKWFTLDGRTHSDLNHAVDQLRDWEAWLAKPANVSAFLDIYQVPDMLRRRRLDPRYVLIHGRRTEFEGNPRLEAKRSTISKQNYRLMTFDRLQPDFHIRDFGCVTTTEAGYVYASVPASFRLHQPTQRKSPSTGLQDVMAAQPDMSDRRRARLLTALNDHSLGAVQPAPGRSLRLYRNEVV